MPDIVIGQDGKNFAVKRSDGRFSIASSRSEKYAAERWLSKSADPASLKQAASRGGIVCDDKGCVAKLKTGQIFAVVRHPEILNEECRRADVVIVTFRHTGNCEGARLLISRKDLRRNGVHAIYLFENEMRVKTAGGQLGRRPWSGRELWFKAPENQLQIPETPENGKPDGKPSKNTPPVQVKI